MVVIAEGYATAATIAKNANVTAIAAFDSGNLLAVATALRERYKDKPIIIAGDDDHRLENNPGREKARTLRKEMTLTLSELYCH